MAKVSDNTTKRYNLLKYRNLTKILSHVNSKLIYPIKTFIIFRKIIRHPLSESTLSNRNLETKTIKANYFLIQNFGIMNGYMFSYGVEAIRA